MQAIRYDAQTPIKKFEVDQQTGFIHINHVPLYQAMVQPYRKADGSVVMEAKTPENVLSAETVASANHIPVTNDHPSELVTKDNAAKYMDGFTADNAHVENDRVYNDLTITDSKLINAISKGKQELSIGFTTNIVPKSGSYKGVHYDALQTNVQINHVAVVNRGRAGHSVRLTADSAAAVIDDEKKGQQEMPKKDDLKAVVDADNSNSQTANSNSTSGSNSSSNSNSSSGGNGGTSANQDPREAEIATLRQQVQTLQQQNAQLQAKIKSLQGNNNSSSSSNSNSNSNSSQSTSDSALARIDSLEAELKDKDKKLAEYQGDALDKKIAEKLDLESKVKKIVGDSYDFKDKDGKLKSDKQMKIDAIKAIDNVPKDFDEKAKSDMYVDTYFDIVSNRKPKKAVVGVNPAAKRTDANDLQAKAQAELQARYNLAKSYGKEDK